MVNWLTIQFANIADICTSDQFRTPINTVSNIGALVLLWRILAVVKRGRLEVNGTTITIDREEGSKP